MGETDGRALNVGAGDIVGEMKRAVIISGKVISQTTELFSTFINDNDMVRVEFCCQNYFFLLQLQSTILVYLSTVP